MSFIKVQNKKQNINFHQLFIFFERKNQIYHFTIIEDFCCLPHCFPYYEEISFMEYKLIMLFQIKCLGRILLNNSPPNKVHILYNRP